MQTQTVKYQADRLVMESQMFFESAGGRRPGLLVFPEAFGLGEHALARAERLASLGYVALACDLHGERKVFTEMDHVMALLAPLRADVSRIRARAAAGLDALKRHPAVDPDRIAAIGYCFGGTMALELARSGANILGAVGFHSGLSTTSPRDAEKVRGKILVCIGADDPGIPIEQRIEFEEEMRLGKVDWQMVVFGGVVHSFTNPQADRLGQPEFARYDAKADARSWEQMRSLFDEIF